MKKIIAMLLASLMVLTLGACGKKNETPPETTQAPSTAPATEPAPTTEPAVEIQWEPGTARAGDLGALFRKLQRGEEVKVLGQWKDYFVIEGEEADLLIEKRFLRPDTEDAFEAWEGWARWNTQVFTTGYLAGDPVATLGQNKKVQVVDGKGNWLYITWDGGEGYVDADQVGKWPVSSGGSSSGGSGGGGGGSSGPMDGTDVYLPGLAAHDLSGVKIQLLGVYNGPEYETFDNCKGLILSDETEAYLCIYLRGEEVKVTEVGEETCSILVGEFIATVPRWAVWMEGDAVYEPWVGYGRWGKTAWTEYQMRNELQTISTNQRIRVVDELTEIGQYVIEEENGEIGYTFLDSLSRKAYVSGGGSGSSGGGSGSGGSGGGDEWTPPAM